MGGSSEPVVEGANAAGTGSTGDGHADTLLELNEQEVINEDKVKADAVYKIFETYINAEAENTAFLVKSHPKGKVALDKLAEKVLVILKEFIVEGKVPEIHTVTKEQLESSFSGFWVARAKKLSIKRERPTS